MGKGGRHQHAVVLQHPADLGEGLLRLRNNMQGVGHDDHLKAAVGVGQVKHVLHGEMQFGGSVVPLRFCDHLRRSVCGLNMSGTVYNVFGNQPRACGQLQHGFVPHHGAQQLVQPLISCGVLSHEAVVPSGVFIPEIFLLFHCPVLIARC